MNTRRSLLTFGALVVLVMFAAPAQGQTPVVDAADACATTESTTVPACPTEQSLDVERVRFTSFDVTWEWERASPANAMVKEFLVRYQEGGIPFSGAAGAKTINSMKVRPNPDGDEDYVVTITGLKPGTTYGVGITSIAPTGAPANNSTELGVMGTTDPARAPDDVLGLELTPGDMMIMAMWDEATDNGSDVTDYQVQHREVGKVWPTTSSRSGGTSATPPNTTTTWTISNLKNGTEYEVRVRAKSYGMSSSDIWSDVKSATPMAGGATPTTPTPTPALPLFGAFALGAGLLAGGRARLRRRREQHQLTR